MKKTVLFLGVLCLLYACQSKSETKNSHTESTSSQETVVQDDNYEEDDYVGDEENKSYPLGNITFSAGSETITITDFGLDPYTILTWFTPESGIDPVAAVVFKSSDFNKSVQFNLVDFDGMQKTFNGEKQIKGGMPLVTFMNGDINYIFESGDVVVEEFSRETGVVKFKVRGKCNKTDVSFKTEMQMGLDATLEVDALMPYTSVDGVATKTEAARKMNVQ